MSTVIVVGLGVMGAAAIDALAARGLRVLGLERFDLGHARGSSHGATRVIRTAYFEDPAYVPLLREAWSRWLELEESAGERLLVKTGALHFGPADHADLEAVRRSAREHALPVEELTARGIARRFPALRPGAADAGVLEPDGGFLAAERCVLALARRAEANGATVRTSERALAVEVQAAGVEVRTDRGVHRADHLVLAQGAWSEGDASVLPIPVPLAIERQVQLWFTPREPALVEPDRLPVFLRFGAAGAFYGIPRGVGPGVKVCAHHGGAATRAEELDREVHASDEAGVREFVRAHVPAADGPLAAASVCLYSNTPDDRFAIGPHPAFPQRVVIACGFSGHGFKLAPVVGRLVAEHVDGAPAHPLFDPARF